MLGAKANPITALTGVSHEKLNIWHNWVAWAMFVLALIHTFPFIVYHQREGDIKKEWKTGGVWVTGVVALIAQAWLTFMSIPWIRYAFIKRPCPAHFNEELTSGPETATTNSSKARTSSQRWCS